MSFSEKALNDLQNNNLNEYKSNFNEALSSDSDDMLFSLAEEIYSLGFSDDALKIYKQLLKKYPDEDEIRTYIADILISKDETGEALNYLNEIKPDSEYYVNALLVEADLYQTQDLFVVSEHKLLEAEKIDPNENVIKFALAELYYAAGKYKQAIPIYLDIIKQGELSISSVNLVERLGVSYAQVGKFKQAIGYLEQIKPINMTPDVQFETGFTYLQLGKYKQAIEMFERLRDTDPQYSTLYVYLGKALRKDNKPQQALRTYQEGIGIDQYNVGLYLEAADTAAELGEKDLVVKYLKQGNKANPENMVVIIKLSDVYIKKGEFQKDIDFLNPYVKEHDTDPQIYWDLANAYSHLEKYKDAASYYKKAYLDLQDNPDFLKQYILFLRENGQVDKTVDLLRKYVKLVPDDEEMVYMLEDLE